MKSDPFVFLMTVTVLLVFIGYCYAIIDWIQDVRSGLYFQQPFEAAYETSALVLYHFLGVRFAKKNVGPF